MEDKIKGFSEDGTPVEWTIEEVNDEVERQRVEEPAKFRRFYNDHYDTLKVLYEHMKADGVEHRLSDAATSEEESFTWFALSRCILDPNLHARKAREAAELARALRNN